MIVRTKVVPLENEIVTIRRYSLLFAANCRYVAAIRRYFPQFRRYSPLFAAIFRYFAAIRRYSPLFSAILPLFAAMFRYVADPHTPFKNVSSIPPGTIVYVNADITIRFTRFWQPSYEQHANRRSISNDEGVELLKSTIDQGVQSQFVSDVKVGLELSGGVDSSLLAWAAEGSGIEGYSASPTLETLSEESHIDRVCETTSTPSNKI